MRLDLVSKRLTGSYEYVEELMILNNIINRWNVVPGDTIYYLEDMEIMKSLEKIKNDNGLNTKQKRDTRVDINRQKGVPPTIKPLNLETLTVDMNTQKIKINNKLQ